MAALSVKKYITEIRYLIPPLNGKLHKGQSGRVGVLGGALDYTGAPYFAAISALKVGVDLSHVICSPTAADAIKSYSPDLIVHPILRPDSSDQDVRSELDSLFRRLHVLVVGPGLGREDYMQRFAKIAVDVVRKQNMYCVFDADALYMIGKDPDIVRGYDKAVLTPNVVEYKRLAEALKLPGDADLTRISDALGGVTILQKGQVDRVAKGGQDVIEVDSPGGKKRCGGQGDVLSGSIGAFLAWGKNYEEGVYGDKGVLVERIPLLAAAGASSVTRVASRRAFAREGRGTVTENLLPEIGGAFAEVFGEEEGRSTKL